MIPARTRFAPSPTGGLHIGGVRTALFSWLLARHTGGQFVLRIEDTDQQRKVEGSLKSIYDSLRWVGLDWDEGPDVDGPYGPYVQSERLAFYQDAARSLIQGGYAYQCDCTPERLERVRERQRATGQPTGYDGHCRDRAPEELAASRKAGNPVVVRMKVPRTRSTSYEDAIRGTVTLNYRNVTDFVVLKSDGFPTYHLAYVVDDHHMKITHVLRGEEWLASVPRHLLVYEGLGIEPPVLAHLPIILDEDRSKLSKRRGATSALEFRNAGYLPEALFNFLALLGWSPGGDQEILSREDTIRLFTLDRVKEAPAIFDRTKLEWMNGVHIRNLAADQLTDAVIPFLEDPDRGLPADVVRPLDRVYVRSIVPMVQDRLRYLSEAPDLLGLFFEEEVAPTAAEIVQKKMDARGTVAMLETALDTLRGFEPFEAGLLEAHFRGLAAEMDVKVGAFFGSLRVALTARKVAPPLFDTMVALGRAKCLERIEHAIDTLESAADQVR